MLHRVDRKPLLHRMYEERNSILDQYPQVVQPAIEYNADETAQQAITGFRGRNEHRHSLPTPYYQGQLPQRRRLHRNNEDNMSIHHDFVPEDAHSQPQTRNNSYEKVNMASPQNMRHLVIRDFDNDLDRGFAKQVYSPQNPN